MTTPKLTKEKNRMDRITSMFGTIQFNNIAFNIAEIMADNYNGGFWDYLEDENGRFLYMAPTSGNFDISVEGNGFTGNVDADTFGIIVTLTGLSHLMMYLFEKNKHHGHEHLNDLFFRLRQVALEHENAATIMQAID